MNGQSCTTIYLTNMNISFVLSGNYRLVCIIRIYLTCTCIQRTIPLLTTYQATSEVRLSKCLIISTLLQCSQLADCRRSIEVPYTYRLHLQRRADICFRRQGERIHSFIIDYLLPRCAPLASNFNNNRNRPTLRQRQVRELLQHAKPESLQERQQRPMHNPINHQLSTITMIINLLLIHHFPILKKKTPPISHQLSAISHLPQPQPAIPPLPSKVVGT